MLKNQRAAMFGLDARIALAIFAGLTLVTGAALYTAITTIQANNRLGEMRAVAQAVSQYMLDTRRDLPDSAYPKIANLRTNVASMPGWNGPYLPEGTLADIAWTTTWNAGRGAYGLVRGGGQDSANGPFYFNAGGCAGTLACHYWVVFIASESTNTALRERMDMIVDNGDGAQFGSFRWHVGGTRYLLQGPETLQWQP